MLEKIKKMFTEKDDKKKMENLVSFLIILVINLVIINRILSGDEEVEDVSNDTSTQLVTETNIEEVEIDSDLETELANILSKISGVRKN